VLSTVITIIALPIVWRTDQYAVSPIQVTTGAITSFIDNRAGRRRRLNSKYHEGKNG